MKKHLLILALFYCSFSGFSQSKKLEIVCQVYQGSIDYGDLERLLPDSVKQNTLLPLKKYPNLSQLGIVNALCLSGWSFVGISEKVQSSSLSGAYSNTAYHLKREIEVSEEQFQAIQNKLKEFRKQ